MFVQKTGIHTLQFVAAPRLKAQVSTIVPFTFSLRFETSTNLTPVLKNSRASRTLRVWLFGVSTLLVRVLAGITLKPYEPSLRCF